METEQAYLRSVRSVLMEAFDGDDHHGAALIVDLVTDNVRDLLRLDAVIELAQGNDHVARRIMEDVRDMIQLDYINSIRSATALQHIFQLIQDDPWDNDWRVVDAGFRRILEVFGPIDGQEPLPEMNPGHWAIVLSGMDAHRLNPIVQVGGARVITLFAERSQQFLVSMEVNPYESLVVAMLLHKQLSSIQFDAATALIRLLVPLYSVENRGQIAAQFVRAPQGKRLGIHAMFRALENFPTDRFTVHAAFCMLCLLDVLVHEDLVNYTNANGNWREILGNTDPEHRPHQLPDNGATILGTGIEDF